MGSHHLKLVRGGLYRTPLSLLEMQDPAVHRKSWDLGYHHAKRGKEAEPDNPAVGDQQGYIDGYRARQRETGEQGRGGQGGGQPAPGGRPEQDIEPTMRLPLHDVPKTVGQVTAAVAAAGGRGLLIGGAVRDKLMGKTPKDFDIEVYGLHPDKLEQVLGTLGQVDAVGKSFGVLKIVIGDEDFDVSVPRRESKTGAGHKGFIPVPDPSMTIKEAARRRDFTMNTVAMDPHTGDVFDPYNGVQDLQDRVLRATDPSAFAEDPLRILRGAQFAARFDMTVDPETMKLMQQASPELVDLPVERVGAEWRKLLMKGEKPSMGMEVMKQAGVLKALHPELDAMEDTPQDAEWHPEGNVWIHTKMVADRATELTRGMPPETQEAVRYAAVMHDISKPQDTFTDDNGRIRSPRHEENGGRVVSEIFRRQFDVSKELADKVAKLTADHLKPQVFFLQRDTLTDGAIRRLAGRLAPATIGELVLTAHADHTGRGENGPKDFPAGDWLMKKAEELQVDKEPVKPILMGRHLMDMGMKPSPMIGDVLRKVFDMQVDGKVHDLASAQAAAQQLIQAGPQREWLGREQLNLLADGPLGRA